MKTDRSRRQRARPRAAFDPISLEIHWARLVSMVDEAAMTFRHTSFSTLVREANDFAVVLTDHRGNSLAQSSVSIPAFLGTLPKTVQAILERFPVESLAPGDFILTNDPWLGTGHVYDVNGVMPLFHRGRVAGFAAVASHVPDIGGQIWSTSAREIFEEGLQIPPMKLLDAGNVVEALVDIIERNVRVPELTMGDIWGQLAACRLLHRRLSEFLEETAVDIAVLGREIRGRSEAAMRRAVERLPDGEYRSVVHQDGFEDPVIIRCALTVRGSDMHIDYTGSSPQLDRAVNVVPAYTFAYSAYAVKCVLEPELPNNEGSFRPITTSAPVGSVLNARYPAATGARAIVGHALVPAVIGALASILPEGVPAQGSSNASFTLTGTHSDHRYISINFFGAGQGAASHRDGQSVLPFPSNVGNTPIEVMETTAPVTVIHRRIRRGSGGAGNHRGGDGQEFLFEFRGDEPAELAVQVRCTRFAATGARGGDDGALARLRIKGKAATHDRRHVLEAGDRVSIETGGGGGFGAAMKTSRPLRRR